MESTAPFSRNIPAPRYPPTFPEPPKNNSFVANQAHMGALRADDLEGERARTAVLQVIGKASKNRLIGHYCRIVKKRAGHVVWMAFSWNGRGLGDTWYGRHVRGTQVVGPYKSNHDDNTTTTTRL